ncbi:hypothetical protein H4S07_005464 [Coemansia furcata]|uniref:Uncharacterized protein n=1 Tax=Coemansia furcata TaxID=417177 RepID=A0ACC1L1Z0_9FUNG|nr:hypothetical protein H4S07_005464 [Coemansia furcata]
MARNGKLPAESQSGFQVGAGDLEGLVFISGPCSALPNRCTRQRIPAGVVYWPEVEVRDGSERLYSKYNLALFEVLDKGSSGATPSVEEHDEGPAAAVLRRRRRRQQQSNESRSELRVAKSAASKREAADEVEDTSDEHYRKLHRKPEYMERRIRNREIELYQYAQWQEGQRMGSERWRQLNGSHPHLAAHQQLGHAGGGGGSEAGGSDATGATQPQSRCASPLPPSAKPGNGSRVVADAGATKVEEADLRDGTTLINETLRRLNAMQTSDATARKRFKSGMRNELRSLLDSSGYHDARARSSASNNNEDNNGGGSGNEASRPVRKESPPSPPAVPSVLTTVSNTSIVSADVATTGGESVQQEPLSESERKVAHLGGSILEQLLVQAARLPPLAGEEASDESDESEDEASDKVSDEEEVSDEASDGESQSDNGSSSDDDEKESDVDNASDSPEAEEEEDAGDSCCCPREFELPQRLFGHMTRQREQQRL